MLQQPHPDVDAGAGDHRLPGLAVRAGGRGALPLAAGHLRSGQRGALGVQEPQDTVHPGQLVAQRADRGGPDRDAQLRARLLRQHPAVVRFMRGTGAAVPGAPPAAAVAGARTRRPMADTGAVAPLAAAEQALTLHREAPTDRVHRLPPASWRPTAARTSASAAGVPKWASHSLTTRVMPAWMSSQDSPSSRSYR